MDLLSLLPNFGSALFTIGAFVLALSIIVAIHEYGHYIVGRWSGIDAEVFSIGFGTVLWSRYDKRGTRWQVAALPLGGYVKFRGDANAASVGAAKDATPARNTMTGAPLWARAATVAAGPVFNFIFALGLFWALLMTQGQPVTPLTIGTMPDLPARYENQLRPGDALVALNGKPAGTAQEFAVASVDLPAQPVIRYTVLRDGQQHNVTGPLPGMSRVYRVSPRSAALKAGLQEGDVLMAIDGQEVFSFATVSAAIDAAGGDPVTVTVWRAGQLTDHVMTPRVVDLPMPDGSFTSKLVIGITGGPLFEPVTETAGPVAALSLAADRIGAILRSSLSGIKHVLTGQISSCNVSSFVGIAEVTGAVAAQDRMDFLSLIGVLSVAVGLFNLFPIPILDGGHLVFHAYEAVTGRPPSERALGLLMRLGGALLLTLTVFLVFNDVIFCR